MNSLRSHTAAVARALAHPAAVLFFCLSAAQAGFLALGPTLPAIATATPHATVPSAARGPLSAAVGERDPRYRVVGLSARNPAQRLGASLSRVARAPALSSDVRPQLAELTASDGAREDGFGVAVAVSGNTLVVATLPSVATAQRGAVYVFERPASGWAHATQTAKLTLSDGAAASIDAVAVSDETVVVGAQDHKVGANDDQGAAYVFVKPSTGWADAHETAELTATDGAVNESLGTQVAVSGDTVVASASGHKVGTNDQQGAAYVFVRPAAGWKNATQTAELTASDGAPQDSLNSVAISGDTIVAGASRHQVGANKTQGVAYVFIKPIAGWANAAETAELRASDGTGGDLFGYRVAISDGTIAVGAPFHEVGLSQEGAAYVFVRSIAGWSATQTAELTPSDGVTNDRFGTAVAVSDDAVVVGALLHQVGASEAEGAAYLFPKPQDAPWASNTESQKLTPVDGAPHDLLGDAVAMSGNTAFASAPAHTVGANLAQGVIYAFAQPPTVTIDAPADGGTFTQGQAVLASYSCTPARGDTIATCAGAVATGAPLDTSALGGQTFTVAATDGDGVTATRTVNYTVVPAPTDVHHPPPLSIAALRQSASVWRVGRKLASSAGKRKRPVGTTYSFKLNRPAHVALQFSRSAHGRAARAGRVRLSGRAGSNRIRFQGHISRTKRLRPGRYTLQVTATDDGGQRSRSRTLKFTIVR
jgi:hypothetical protein